MRSTGTPCYLFDIDGTLANGDHRLHFIRPAPMTSVASPATSEFKPDWDAYFDACDKDAPHPHIVQLCKDLGADTVVLFVSGRAQRCRDKTVAWLEQNLGCSFSREVIELSLFMRADDDHRDDDILKIELLAEVRKCGYEPIMVFDDRNRVVKAWRAAGVPCAQVQEGDF